MKGCISYALAKGSPGITFNFTTNGTLLTNDIASYCAEHGIRIVVSLDGPKEVHESRRVFRAGGGGTWKATMAALAWLERAYGDRYQSLVSLSCVYGPWTNLEVVEKFFMSHPLVRDLACRVSRAYRPFTEGLDVTCGPMVLTYERMHRRWRQALVRGELDHSPKWRILRQLFEEPLSHIYRRSRSALPEGLPLAGQCLPGLRKFYVDCEGRILPCERVSERFDLGNVRDGRLSAPKSLEIRRQVSEFYASRCINCIFYRLCEGCIASFSDSSTALSEEAMSQHCNWSIAVNSAALLEWVTALEENPECFDYLEVGS